MKVAVAQLNPKIGAFSKTFEKAKEAVASAKRQGASLVLFPEMFVTGYTPQDLLDYPSFIDANLKTLDRLATLADGIALVVGYVDKNPAISGKRFFNSAALLRKGKIEARYHKQLLPYYDIFNEERYFEPGESDLLFFEHEGKCFAVSICEEIWNFPGFLARGYHKNPLEILKTRKVDALLNLSASPFHLGKPQSRVMLLKKIAKTYDTTIFYCDQVGANDELIFDGCSLILSPSGIIQAQAPAFEEAVIVGEVGGKAGKISAWPEQKVEWLARALELGIRDYVLKCGLRKVCLGLSGGIDSAVVAQLAVNALGAENVLAVLLPSRFSANEGLEDATRLGKNLGVKTRTISIEPVLASYEKQWLESEGEPLKGLAHENLQPRIRMTWLMAISNKENRLLLNTSNKSEIAMGYSTLYGDSSGAIAVLGDLVKNEVYELARYFNSKQEVIPKRILERAPSAELRHDQTDQDSLPPYDILDNQVRQVTERTTLPTAEEAKEAIWATFNRFYTVSEYKRKQLPPALRVTQRAFGMGRRVPIAATPQDN